MIPAADAPRTGLPAAPVIEGRTEEGRARLTVRGELVLGCAGTLAATLDALPAGVGRVELDVAGVSFMDTTGLEFLDVLEAYGRRYGVPVAATGWRGQPRRVLELVGRDTAGPPAGLPAPEPPGSSVCSPSAPAVALERSETVSASAVALERSETVSASAVALERSETVRLLRLEIEQLRQAIDSRPVIDQARGILMAAHACTPEQAWDILREASQLSNTKLREVAAAVTASTTPDGPPPPEDLRTALRAAADHRLA
ncbi:ANTAR domain-containing protein [Streptomyces sp. L2]|uniref:ANTAR domain-containing protein n=1 Tax=Streptomyces sp. L2 TaxID=2162665 RepID=UPI0010133720|nr:ANTAR domain-containing protein [Streptomyces sp. L2]